VSNLPPSVAELGVELRTLGWVTALFVAGSAATGDYTPGISDLDLVALTAGPVDHARGARLRAIHSALDGGAAARLHLGCAYVVEDSLTDELAQYLTWTHGSMVRRTLSGITRAELVRHGYAVFGPQPQALLPAVDDDDVRRAALAELTGYWSKAAARPWWWLDPVMIDLGLTSMARGRHELSTGELLTKTRAIEAAHAPAWLIEQVRARRRGEQVRSPRLRGGWFAWRDARRTTAIARRWIAPTR